MSLTIVLGTGRCGSTMLSRILHMHPDVLSLSEFWNIFMDDDANSPGHDIPTHAMTGDEYWQRITRCNRYTDGLTQAGLDGYRDHGRFDLAKGVPFIYRILDTLTRDPDALYDKLAPVVPAWPRRPMADHCRALFGELAGLLGRQVAVERTGGSVSIVSVLRQQFPEARFVFLHRDGPDSALSMSRHPPFRLAALRMVANAISNPSSGQLPLPEEIRNASPEDFKGLIAPPFDTERFMTFPIPLAFFGWLWSMLTRVGTDGISDVPPGSLMTLRYENLLGGTQAELTRLTDFIGVPAYPQWLEQVREFVDRGRPGAAVAQLHPSDLAALRAACAIGTRAYESLESRARAVSAAPS